MFGESLTDKESVPRRTNVTLLTQRATALALVAIVLILLYCYPFGRWAMFILLGGYALLLWRFSHAWLIVVPAALPLLDFGTRSGWILIDEFDLVVMTTLALGLWRAPFSRSDFALTRSDLASVGLLTISHLLSIFVGVVPLGPFDWDWVNPYYSHYNSLRVGKGLMWALLLLPLFGRSLKTYPHAHRLFSYGMLLGLTGLGLVIVWERVAFPGALNFESEYRVSGTFSSMHIGGGSIDAYLAIALPFVAVVLLDRRRCWALPVGLIVSLLGIHAVLVTFSRGLYVAFLLSMLVLVFSMSVGSQAPKWFVRCTTVAFLAALAVLVVKSSPLVRSRLSTWREDSRSRIWHWKEALAMRDDHWLTELLGMGLGSYPRVYYLTQSGDRRPGTFEVHRKGKNTYLRLVSGSPLYLRQHVKLSPYRTYRLSFELRVNPGMDAYLHVFICEQALNYSFRCVQKDCLVQDRSGDWIRYQEEVDTGDVGESGRRLGRISRRQVHFGLYLSHGIVDIDNVALVDENGRSLIANSDFSEGSDRWYFEVDDKVPWHVDNDFIYLLFEKGYLGLLSYTLLVALTVVRLAAYSARGDTVTSPLLSAIAGYLVVGLANSPMDTPRIATLFFVVLFSGLVRCHKPWTAALA